MTPHGLRLLYCSAMLRHVRSIHRVQGTEGPKALLQELILVGYLCTDYISPEENPTSVQGSHFT